MATGRGKKKHHARPLERDVLPGVLEAVRLYCPDAQRQNTGMAFNPRGQAVPFGRRGNADITATIPWPPYEGRRLEVEVKRPGERPTPEQYERIRQVLRDGGVAFWVDDPADAVRFLERLRQGWRVYLDAQGVPWVTDEPRGSDPPGSVG